MIMVSSEHFLGIRPRLPSYQWVRRWLISKLQWRSNHKTMEYTATRMWKGLVIQGEAKVISRLELNPLNWNSSRCQLLATSTRGGYAAFLDRFTAQILQTLLLPMVDDGHQQNTITACFKQVNSPVCATACNPKWAMLASSSTTNALKL